MNIDALEDIVAKVRTETAWLPNETLVGWLERTARLSREQWEATHPPLPLVEASKRRSDRLLATEVKKGLIAPETSDEETDNDE